MSLPADPVAPVVTSFTATGGTATVVFDQPMDTSTGLTGTGWTYKKASQLYTGAASASWLNSTTLQVIMTTPVGTSAGQTYGFTPGADVVKSLAGLSLGTIVNHAF